jgi:hypothetical protein
MALIDAGSGIMIGTLGEGEIKGSGVSGTADVGQVACWVAPARSDAAFGFSGAEQ